MGDIKCLDHSILKVSFKVKHRFVKQYKDNIKIEPNRIGEYEGNVG